MNTYRLRLVAVLMSIMVSSCASRTYYLDPSQPRITYDALSRVAEPLRLKVNVEYRSVDIKYNDMTAPLKLEVTEALERSGLVKPTDGPDNNGEVLVILDQKRFNSNVNPFIAFASGLSLGLVGPTQEVYYEMEVVVQAKGKTARQRGIQLTLLTTIGRAAIIPGGAEQIDSGKVLQRVVELMLLRALLEMQKSGDFPQQSILKS